MRMELYEATVKYVSGSEDKIYIADVNEVTAMIKARKILDDGQYRNSRVINLQYKGKVYVNKEEN